MSLQDILKQTYRACIEELGAENKRLRAEEIMRLNPPHKHDHEYFHDDCTLCQIEKRDYAKTQKALKESE